MTEQQRLPFAAPSFRQILEALIFASDEPLTPKDIIGLLDTLEDGERLRRVSEESILEHIDAINSNLEETGRPFRVVKVAGGWQFATQQQFAPWLGKMLRERTRRKLSIAALESLAVIAYKQPVTKPELEAIRGVNADYVLRSLLERNLVTIVGRAATPGRPLLYGTTKEFLKHFGLNDLSELPKLREIDELMAEAEFEVEKKLLRELEEKALEEGGGADAGETIGTGSAADGEARPMSIDELTRDPQ
jgi:segregation and condensation protein B